MDKPLILVVEDDRAVRSLVTTTLDLSLIHILLLLVSRWQLHN